MAERSRRTQPLAGRRAAPIARRGETVLVIGLGRFGSAVAMELERLGFEVLGVDGRAEIVQRYADDLTHVLQADTTNPDSLRQIGAAEFSRVVVAIGSDVEASILTVAALEDLGVHDIWAKAVTDSHGRILERIGAHHVVFPEHDMGLRVAHVVSGRMLDWFQLDEDFAMVETLAPKEIVGRSFTDLALRSRYGVTVVAIKPMGGTFTYATADTVLQEGDVLVVSGATEKAEAFAQLT